MQIRFLRTESFRLTAIFAALFVGAMLIFMVLVYEIMHEAFRNELLLAAGNDLASVQKAFATEGMPEAKEVVAQHLVKSAATDFLVLESTSGEKLAGNLPYMTPRLGEQIIRMPAEPEQGRDDEEERSIIGQGAYLAPGLFAFAGRDLSIANATEDQVLNAFGFVLVATLILAFAGGIFLSHTFLARMDAITRTCRAIIAGHLNDRIPERGTRDELDRLVMTINTMLDRIGALMENIQQISNDIAHDLRTPLTRLRHHLELAGNESATVADYAQAVDRAIDESDDILTTFSALLRIGQIEAAAKPALLGEVDLSGLLQELTEIYVPAAADSGYELSATLAPSVIVQGDRELLSQMFANLIENALTHTPAGTAITVELRMSDGRAVASVSDNGPGIPVEEQEKVLRRFYRLEPARSRPGSGLGLSLVAAIAQYHSASVAFGDSKPGLKVEVTFPTGGFGIVAHGLNQS